MRLAWFEELFVLLLLDAVLLLTVVPGKALNAFNDIVLDQACGMWELRNCSS